MSVSKMKKLLVVAPADSSEAIIKKLISLRCIDLRDFSECEEESLLQKKSYDAQISVINSKIQRIESVLLVLSKNVKKKATLGEARVKVDREAFISSGLYEDTCKFVEGFDVEAESIVCDAATLQNVETLYDIEKTNLLALESMDKTAHSESCTFICGWMPKKAQKGVEKVLDECLCAYEITEPTSDDKPPVKLSNNVFTRCFEWITTEYTQPKYRSFDPTLIMSIFFFIAFGLMVSDVGYGLMLIPLGFIAPVLLGTRGKHKNILNMLGICGISSVIFGILFGGWFGNMPYTLMDDFLWIHNALEVAPIFNGVIARPAQKPLIYLAIVLGFGALQIIVGMIIKFITLCKEGKAKDALLDILPWWVIFAGIALILTFNIINVLVGLAVIIVGAVLIIIFGGRAYKGGKRFTKGCLSLCNIARYLLNLAGYLKIFVVGLTFSVVTYYINVLGAIIGPTFGGYALYILVSIVCHGIFFMLNVFVAHVIAKKIQHNEFFAQFLCGGGDKFAAAEPSEKFTIEASKK